MQQDLERATLLFLALDSNLRAIATKLLMDPGAAGVGASSSTQVQQPGTEASQRCIQRELGLRMVEIARHLRSVERGRNNNDAQAWEALRAVYTDFMPAAAPEEVDLLHDYWSIDKLGDWEFTLDSTGGAQLGDQ